MQGPPPWQLDTMTSRGLRRSGCQCLEYLRRVRIHQEARDLPILHRPYMGEVRSHGLAGALVNPGVRTEGHDLRAFDEIVVRSRSEVVPVGGYPLKPFQGTLGVAPPDGYFPALSPGVTNAVPPGPHAGNLDLSELSEGSTLYIPVWKPAALIYTGDSHAVQGDGEICLTAIETRMRELEIQVFLHKQKGLAWPAAETDTHWIIMGLDRNLHAAMSLAARNAIKFLAVRAKLTELDAYALCSIAVSFRVTQVVDIVQGVHALIPKSIFASELRQQMKVV
jgi:acetamidase/formamidase